MHTTTEVMVMPMDKTTRSLFLLAVFKEEDPTVSSWANSFYGWIRADGSFTEGVWSSTEADEAISFTTAEEAIQWARARGYRVVNEVMFGRRSLTMPSRLTVSVTEANYTPWFAQHEIIKRRQEAGELVRQINIRFDPLTDMALPWQGCSILIDEDAIRHLKAAGIPSPAEMVGRILVLASDDTSEPFRPLRIVQILKK